MDTDSYQTNLNHAFNLIAKRNNFLFMLSGIGELLRINLDLSYTIEVAYFKAKPRAF